MQKYGSETNPEEWEKFTSITILFEHMGILAKEGSVNPHLIIDWIGDYPIRYWDKFEEIIDGFRIEYEYPPKGMWREYFENLADMLRDVMEENLKDFDGRLMRRRVRREERGRPWPDLS